MGSLSECRIEGFICRLCSQIDRNVIHIYTDEGLQKKLEQKINVYLKINLSRFDPLPKVICLPCDVKLEQHHRFIQRVIQNQKKIQQERPGERPIIPLLEQHLRVRVSPVIRDDGSGSNTFNQSYNIEAISSSDSDSDEQPNSQNAQLSQPSHVSLNTSNNSNEADQAMEPEYSDMEALSSDDDSSSSSGSSSIVSLGMGSNDSRDNDEPLAGFSPSLEPVNAQWSNDTTSSDSSGDPPEGIEADDQEEEI